MVVPPREVCHANYARSVLMKSLTLPWLVAEEAGGQGQLLLQAWLQACWQLLVMLMVDCSSPSVSGLGNATVSDAVGDTAVVGDGSSHYPPFLTQLHG